jgi:hypothetical protein
MQGRLVVAKKGKANKHQDTVTDSSDIGDTGNIGDTRHTADSGNSADTGGLLTVVYGDSLALGEDTLTVVNADVEMKDAYSKTVAKGKVIVLAAAESPDGGDAFADTTADISVSGADKVKIKEHTLSIGDDDSAYEITILKFKATDSHNETGGSKIIEKTTEKNIDGPVDLHHLDGNLAVVFFDNQVNGYDTFADADAFALAIEDELSVSTVILASAVG